MIEPISGLILLGIAHLLFPNKKNKKIKDEGDNYIILSEVERDHGTHEHATQDSIWDNDGDAGWDD